MSTTPNVTELSSDVNEKPALVHQDENVDTEALKNLHRHGAGDAQDEAATVLANAGNQEFSASDKKKLLWRIDLHICTVMCLVYFVSRSLSEAYQNAIDRGLTLFPLI